MLAYFMMIVLLLTALFLIVLILIQRGKGGGLAGAFGGMGGQSAFGTKAGDLFTKITIGVAAFWILLCIVSVRFLGDSEDIVGKMGSKAPSSEGELSPDDSGEGDQGKGNAEEKPSSNPDE